MFLIEVIALVGTPRRLSDEEITDIIQIVVDDLDVRSLEPSVGSVRIGDDLEITVGVILDETEEFEALVRATRAVKGAFQSAGIGAAGMVPRDLRSRTTPLQPA